MVAGGITAGVLLGQGGGDDSTAEAQGGAVDLAPPAVPDGSVKEVSFPDVALAPTPATLPADAATGAASSPPPAPAPLPPSPLPPTVSGPPPVAIPAPAPPVPSPAPPPLVAVTAPAPPPPVVIAAPVPPAEQPTVEAGGPSGLDTEFIAAGTTNGAPPAQGFVQAVAAGKKGTCDMQNSQNWLCNDDMDGAGGPTIEDLQLMHDAEAMETCGFADMTTLVNSLVPWAYKRQCGIAAYTVARACIGKPGIADGYWRARVQLWPNAASTGELCIPLCIKLRGFQNTVVDYGRTGSCNPARD
ncbi:hypothetical protein D9Q98_006644 [Chlorella vulgaris]|uniref:Uncharacterized protein n=1 Tax=Chlorella vulgaris TaxID=3077 RepID=A0A9D4YVI9_CHLVU|nr:hypothetical protein D9Q98_006644 [Chlorella vulgaris]